MCAAWPEHGAKRGGVTNFLKIGNVHETYHFPLSAHTSPSVHATLCCALVAAIIVEDVYDTQCNKVGTYEAQISAKRIRVG